MLQFYLAMLFFLGIILAYLANPRLFSLFVKDMRALRMAHYELMLLLGMTLAWVKFHDISPPLSLDILLNIFLCMISLLFSGLFSIVINNLSDIEIDKISNPNRPLIKHEIAVDSYIKFGFCFMAIALFYSAMVNVTALIAMSLFMGFYYVYSAPPLRLKRIIVFSKIAISANSLVLVMLGYVLMQKNINGFPTVLYWIFLVGITLTANFIDLKDVQGDTSAGIVTLPILLGEKKAKVIIGAAFWMTYLALLYILNSDDIIPFVLLFLGGGFQFYLINRKPYNELSVLLFHNLSVVVLIIYLIFHKP